MKKILATLVLFSVLGLLVLPLTTYADTYDIPSPKSNCTLKHDIKVGNTTVAAGVLVGPAGTTGVATSTWGVYCLVDSVYSVLDWVFWVLIIISMILILMGGIIFASAAGDPEKTSKAKKLIVSGIIGMAIAVFSKAIPSVVVGILF